VQRALALLQAGQEAEAQAILEGVLEDEPGNGTARMQLGRLALARGELAAAARHLEIAVEADAQRPYLAWHLLGRVRLAEGRGEEALVCFERSLALAPGFAPARLGRAEAELVTDRLDAALGHLLDLADATAASDLADTARLTAAQLLVYLERPDEAREQLSPLTRRASGGRPLHVPAQALALALDDTYAASMAVEIVLGRNLSAPDVYLAYAVQRARQAGPAASLPPLEIARSIAETSPIVDLFHRRAASEATRPRAQPAQPAPGLAARFATANELFEAGRLAEAAEMAAAIVAERPHHVPAWLLVLADAERRGDLWSALEGYRRLLEWLPGLPALESRLADVAFAMGAHELARCAVERALEAFALEGALHYRLATILAATGDGAAAVAGLERAIELGFDEPEAWLTLGHQRLELMQPAEAIAAFGRALALDPDAAEAIGSFALSSLTSADDPALVELLEEHASAHPENHDTQYALGLLALRRDRPELAEGYLRRAAEAPEPRPEVEYNLAQAYLRQGRPAEAEAAMERFRELEARDNERWEEHNGWSRLRQAAVDAGEAGRRLDALEIYRQLLATAGARIDDAVAAGRLALEAGEPDEAARLFERALEADPYRTDALRGLLAAAEARGGGLNAEALRRRLDLLASPCGEH
jgi:tetratricopeptide (TPR) repeat protein